MLQFKQELSTHSVLGAPSRSASLSGGNCLFPDCLFEVAGQNKNPLLQQRRGFLERAKRFELSTYSLATSRSTTELCPLGDSLYTPCQPTLLGDRTQAA